MRALFMADIEEQTEYVIREDSLHHLVNVVRIKKGENLLLLNGRGLSIETLVTEIHKKEIRLQLIRAHRMEQAYEFHLALGMPKKEALEQCLKEATELGFAKVYLIRSDFSQIKHPEEDRVHRLLISALEQSNAPYLPEVIPATWDEIPWEVYSEALLLDSQSQRVTKKKAQTTSDPRILIVGPEGGFSLSELEFLHQKECVRVVNLPTPILRTPTAVAAGTGLMLQSLL